MFFQFSKVFWAVAAPGNFCALLLALGAQAWLTGATGAPTREMQAITPVLAGVVFWVWGAPVVFVAGAVFTLGALAFCRGLPAPGK